MSYMQDKCNKGGGEVMDKVYLSALGGSGENGRNCYLIGMPDGYLLLDCGVKREIIDGQVGFYPSLTKEITAKIKAVFLSHCHEDHVAGLPLLYQLGYQGKVYASQETIAEVPGFIKKWMDYVEKNHGQLPYERTLAEKIQFAPVELGIQEIEGIQVETGRSGHVLGGIWYIFNILGKRVLYTGDMCKEPGVLAWDAPENCDAAIMNAAYAGKQISQPKQFETLLKSVQSCVMAGGKVMLPVPPKGRGIEIAQFLGKNLSDVKIFVEEAVAASFRELSTKHIWIQDGVLSEFPNSIDVVCTDEERERAWHYQGGAVYITPDGMISTDMGLKYFEHIKGEALNKIIISGHAAKGTVGAGILDDNYRKEHGVLAAGEKIIFKVHMDDEDIRSLSNSIKAKQVVLFHSDAELTTHIKSLLGNDEITAVTLQYPQIIEI